ncbi:MAG: Gfo/Idh/MocA family oxidoreductase [Verrucomicrobiae bacterium]|nr:Gfo/Idh/MocA family oxidoreductase [Verrucomicrobiae bacterium]
MNRRQFLKTATVLAAGPMILPARILGANAPSKKIGIGMIGCGRWGVGTNLPAFLKMNDVRVVAVCDVDAWRLEQAKNVVDAHYQTKDCRAFRDFRELLAHKDVDAVMISTPDHWHVPIAIAAAKARKDFSVEKPISLSISEGRLLADTAKRYNVVSRNDSEFRSLPEMRQACEAVLNGRIGRLRKIITTVPATDVTSPPEPPMPVPPELDYDFWQGPAPDRPYHVKRVHAPHDLKSRPGWMRNQDYCEGIITNWGTHLNDIAQLGNRSDESGPVEVQALRWKQPPMENLWNVLEDFEVWYRYANGVELTYKGVKEVKGVFVRFEGDEGWVQANYNRGCAASDPKLLAPPGPNDIQLPAWQDKEDFIRCVKSRQRTMQDAEVGHRTCSLCQLGHISIKLGGKKLRWNPQTERFDDAEANKLLSRPTWRAPWTLEAL